jgi:hypothetical protein
MPVRPQEVLPTIRSATKTSRAHSERSEDEILALRALPYVDYLQTSWWRGLRNQALREADYRCRECGTKRDLEVHHLTYERLGDELLDDLEVLCRGCHLGEHRIEVQDWIGIYLRILALVLKDRVAQFDAGAPESVLNYTEIAEDAKDRCARLRIPYHHEEFQGAVARLSPRIPFVAPRGKEELYRVNAANEGLGRGESAEIVARLGVAGLIRHMPEIQLMTVREAERLKALRIVAQALLDQVQLSEEIDYASVETLSTVLQVLGEGWGPK